MLPEEDDNFSIGQNNGTIAQRCLQVAMFALNVIIGSGTTFSLFGLWAVQDLIQTESCSDIVGPATNNCCPTCLGFSPVEYNSLASSATLTTLPIMLFGGFLIDRFGMAPFAAGFSVCGVIGNLLRLAASLIRNNHRLTLAFMLIGENLFQWSHAAIYIVRYYVGGHFFSSKVRPFAMGSASGLTYIACVVAFWTLNGFGHRYGVPAVFGLCTALSLIAPSCVAAIAVIDKYMERPYRAIDEADNDLPRIFKSVGRQLMDGRIKIIIIAGGLSRGIAVVFGMNGIVFLMNKFEISSKDAAHYIALGFLICGVFGPISGFLAGHFDVNRALIALGGCLATVGLLFLLLTHVNPMVGIGMINFGSTFISPMIYSLLAELVAHNVYGAFVSITTLLGNVTICVLTALTGVFVQYMFTRMLGWMVSYVCYAGLAASICGIGVVLLVTRERKKTDDSQ